MMRLLVLALVGMTTLAGEAFAQAPRAPEPARLPGHGVDVSAFVTLGLVKLAAADTFDITVGSPLGSIFGGGARVGLPLRGLFVGIGGWRFRHRGERVLIVGREAFSLGVPLEVAITPIELSAGWRFRLRRAPQMRPYVAGGFSSYGYHEVSDFATPSENVDERFNGYHVAGGAEFQVERFVGVALELNWTAVPDALGDGGVSKAVHEDNLGGTSFRFKITVGR